MHINIKVFKEEIEISVTQNSYSVTLQLCETAQS